MNEIEYMGYKINPIIEAKMFILTAVGKDKLGDDLSDASIMRYLKVESVVDIPDIILHKMNAFIRDFDIEGWLKEAQYRSEIYNKSIRLYDSCKGFPMDVDLLNRVLDRSYDICLFAVYEANKVIPNVFFADDTGSFTLDLGVLANEVGVKKIGYDKKKFGSKTVDKVLGKWRDDPKYGPVYTARQTVLTLLGKAGREFPKLLSEDGYIKGGFEQFGQVTSRNTPLSSKGFILNCHTWIRHLIVPKPGEAFIKFDWVAQEPWIASVMTGDQKMIDGYATGDIYAAVAREMGVIPPGGSKVSHPVERALVKELQLAFAYGRTRVGVVEELGEFGGDLFDKHKSTFLDYWNYIDERSASTIENKYFKTKDGWYYFTNIEEELRLLNGYENVWEREYRFDRLTRQLSNAFFQAEGAGLIRKVIELFDESQATRFGLVATHFDAIYLLCKESDINECLEFGENLLNSAAEQYFDVNTHPKPEPEVIVGRNYTDIRGTAFYNKVVDVVNGKYDELISEIKTNKYVNTASKAFGMSLVNLKNKSLARGKENNFENVQAHLYNDRNSLGSFEVSYLNSRYIPAIDELDFPLEGIVWVKSGKGTGKTELLAQVKRDFDKRKLNSYNELVSKNEPNLIPGIALISHRVALSKNLSSRLGLEFYKDVQNLQIHHKPFLGLSVDSLYKLATNTEYFYHTVIIDEAEQVLRHFLASTIKEQFSAFNQFINLIQKASRIILLDADLSVEISGYSLATLLGYNKWRQLNMKVYNNIFKIGNGRNIDLYSNEVMLDANLRSTISNLTDNENLFIAVNWPAKAISIQNTIIGELGIDPSKILTIHGRNSSNPEQSKFIANPVEECQQYRVVIASPSVSTGVSIDPILIDDGELTHHFTHVFGFFHQSPYNHFDIDQAINRVRNTNASVRIWISDDMYPVINNKCDLDIIKDEILTTNWDPKKPPTDNWIETCNNWKSDIESYCENIRNYLEMDSDINWLKSIDYQRELDSKIFKAELNEILTQIKLGVADLASIDELSKIWMQFYFNIMIQDKQTLIGRRQKYIEYVSDLGFQINHVSEIDEIDLALGKALNKKYKSTIKEDLAKAIFDSPNITEVEAAKLDSKSKVTKLEDDEQNKLSRYKISKWLPPDVEISAEIILNFYNKEYPTKSFLLDLFTRKKASEIIAMDMNEHISNLGKKMITSFKHRLRSQEALNEICKSLGYNSSADLVRDAMQNQLILTPSKSGKSKLIQSGLKLSDTQIANFTNHVENNIEELNMLFKINKDSDDTKKKFKSTWNQLIEKNLSISLHARRSSSSTKNNPSYDYYIDTTSNDLIFKHYQKSSTEIIPNDDPNTNKGQSLADFAKSRSSTR